MPQTMFFSIVHSIAVSIMHYFTALEETEGRGKRETPSLADSAPTDQAESAARNK